MIFDDGCLGLQRRGAMVDTTKEQRPEVQQGVHFGQDPALFQCAETG
jgi:hypothetical protein